MSGRRALKPEHALSPSQRYARRMKAEGRCTRCAGAFEGQEWECPACRERSASWARQARARRAAERATNVDLAAAHAGRERRRQKRHHARKRELGICPRCTTRSDRGPGRKCRACLADYRAWKAAKRATMAPAELEAKRTELRAYYAERWAWARRRGLCGECGSKASAPGRARCVECMGKARERQARGRARRQDRARGVADLVGQAHGGTA